jgi:hypothetical protein
MPKCRRCGKKYEKMLVGTTNYKYCPECNDMIYARRGQLLRYGRLREIEVKRLADASGNPKVWTADQCSQDFLRNLIPKS